MCGHHQHFTLCVLRHSQKDGGDGCLHTTGADLICIKGTSQFHAFASLLPTVLTPVTLPASTQCDSWEALPDAPTTAASMITHIWPLFTSSAQGKAASLTPCARSSTSIKCKP